MNYLSGLDRYDQQRDPDDHVLDKVLPANPGPVHAVRVRRFRRLPREPLFLDRWYYERALCGRDVKVLLPLEFDPGDEGSCQRCVGPALRGESAPARRDEE